MKDLHVHLPAVRVAGKRKIVPFRRSNRKDVGAMRQHDIQSPRHNHFFGAHKILVPLSLIVEAGKVDAGLAEL